MPHLGTKRGRSRGQVDEWKVPGTAGGDASGSSPERRNRVTISKHFHHTHTYTHKHLHSKNLQRHISHINTQTLSSLFPLPLPSSLFPLLSSLTQQQFYYVKKIAHQHSNNFHHIAQEKLAQPQHQQKCCHNSSIFPAMAAHCCCHGNIFITHLRAFCLHNKNFIS